MDALLWVTAGFILIGSVVNVAIKKRIERKNASSTKFIVWWIAGITVWGITSILLAVWCFSRLSDWLI
ncbi:hypothetical protein [Bacillus sp. 1P06AnD]|uniref:hypothetical protein n=1 Tax=Bacillus sp. 1P06AnD TaxID=3132208 RepID=UPI00399FE873